MNRAPLFTLRLWCERVGGGRVEWRGVVQNVLTRETFTFRTWNDFIAQVVLLASTGATEEIQAPDKTDKNDTTEAKVT